MLDESLLEEDTYDLFDDKDEAKEQLHQIFRPLQDLYMEIN